MSSHVLVRVVSTDGAIRRDSKVTTNHGHRRSIRLGEYDYSTPGAYFVTICTQNRVCLFGQVIDGAMRSNEAGLMVSSVWAGVAARFPAITVDCSIAMPNHVHV